MLISTTCILNGSICFTMDGTRILVLKLQLITFDLFRDYKSFVSGRSPALCLPSLASSVAGWRPWFWSENSSMDRTVLRNSKANRTVSPGCHGLMHLFTHKHSATKAGENKPHTVSKQCRFWSHKMQQGLLFCFCFSFRIRPLDWHCKQWPGCGHLRDEDDEQPISLSLTCKLNLLMSQAQAHHNYTHRQATKRTRSTVVITYVTYSLL